MKQRKVLIVLGCIVLSVSALLVGRYGCSNIEQMEVEKQETEVKPVSVENHSYEYGFITIYMEEGKTFKTYGKIKILNDGKNNQLIDIVQDTTELPDGMSNDGDN